MKKVQDKRVNLQGLDPDVVTKSTGNLYRLCSLVCWKAPAEMCSLHGSGIHSSFPGHKALGRTTENILAK